MSELAEVITYPRVLHKGVYSLYEKADGTLRVQYRRDDKDEDDYFEVPGFVIALGKQASEGKLNPMQLMSEMQKYARNRDGH